MGKHKNYNLDTVKKYWETTYLTVNQIAEITSISSNMLRYYIPEAGESQRRNPA